MNRGAVPAIMVVQPSLERAETNLIFLQDCDCGSRCKKIRVNSKVCGANELWPELEFSHHGFLVFSHPKNLSLHSIVNPVTLGQHTFNTT